MVPKTCGVTSSEKRGRIKVSLASLQIDNEHYRITVNSESRRRERERREKGGREGERESYSKGLYVYRS